VHLKLIKLIDFVNINANLKHAILLKHLIIIILREYQF